MNFMRGFIVALTFVLVGGCLSYPKGPGSKIDDKVRGWQVRASENYDYYQYLDEDGRTVALGFVDDADGNGEADERIELSGVIRDDNVPHYVIMLDGIPFETVDRLYRQGHFRMFHRPTRLVSCFPSMTDLAFSQIFTPGEVNGYEALWYDRKLGRLSDGNWQYLSEGNAPWQSLIDYRSPMILDPVGYLSPGFVFGQELRGMNDTFDRNRTGTVIGYSVGTATVGTRRGRSGIEKCLLKVEQLCEKLLYERRGRCKLTVLADHGHNLADSQYFCVSEALRQSGFNPTTRLAGPEDVVCVEFGLVTYNAMYTDRPNKVADALLKFAPVELAMYPDPADEGKSIIVRDRRGQARITKVKDGYAYACDESDPLRLLPAIQALKARGAVNDEGAIDDQALFDATLNGPYPDPLRRIWLAFNGLVKHPADLIITVKDGRFCGSQNLARSVNVASTHGSLNRMNSETFVFSMIRELPPAVRISDLPKVIPEILPDQRRK